MKLSDLRPGDLIMYGDARSEHGLYLVLSADGPFVAVLCTFAMTSMFIGSVMYATVDNIDRARVLSSITGVT